MKLITTERRKNYLVSQPNYHTVKTCIKKLLAIDMRKTKILIYKSVFLDLSVLDLSKTVIYEL